MKNFTLLLVVLLLAACAPSQAVLDARRKQIEMDQEIEVQRKIAKEEKDKARAASDKAISEIMKKLISEPYERKMDKIKADYEKELAASEERMKKSRELAKKPGVKIGMSADDVRQKTNWGDPKSVNRTVNRQGVNEQWVYEGGSYLYFRNNKLHTIQN